MTEAITHIFTAEAKPSPYNRRSSQGDIKALAESIGRHGIIQPLVGRQLADGSVEIVAGERRLRAAQLAFLDQVPVILRELTDEQAREACLEENLQRADIHPMDEAEALEQLRDGFGYTAEQLADRFGKSKSYIHKRLKLTSLVPKVRKAFLAGKVDDRTAFEIARVADPAGQEALLTRAGEELGPLGDDDWEWEHFTKLVRDSWMPDLAAAPFDISDALLVAESGSCTACPKRTGQQRELFPEAAKKEDLCLDRACYDQKTSVWWVLETAAAAETGAKVLTEAETKKELAWGGELRYGSPYVESTEELGKVTGDWKSKKQIKTLLKKDPPQRILARDDKGKVRELYDRKEAVAKLKAAGHITKAAAASAATSGPSPQAKAAEARQKKLRKIGERVIDLAIAAAGDAVEAHGDATLFPLARLLCGGASGSATAKARKVKSLDEELEARCAAGDVSWVMRLIVECAIRDTCHFGSLGPRCTAALIGWGIDIDAIEAQAKAEVTAELAAKKAKAKGKGKGKKKPAAAKKKAKG